MRAYTLTILAVLALALIWGCENDDGMTTPETTDPISPDAINTFVDGLSDWEVPSTTMDPPLDLDDEENLEANQYYRCEVTEYDLKKNFDQIVAVGANATALKPGMVVQGKGVRDGSLSTIGLKRSPLTVSVNLALDTPTRRIQNPNSGTIQEAVASLQREADTRLGELDVVPAIINFRAESAFSFEQAMMSAGISLSYSAVFASGSISGSFSNQSSVKTTTVIMKLLQPMYTISFADDEMAEPADFFSPDLTEFEFNRQAQLGTMSASNQPCYVQSVTYGRMVMYTATSTEAQSSSELKAAFEASYGVWSGGGNMTTRQQQLVQNSSIEVQIFGGTQGQAVDAIKQALRTGDFSAFLTPVPATTAVPLSYRINDLKNRQPAVIGDATKYKVRECEAVNDFLFKVTLDSIVVVNGCDREQTFDIECFAGPQVLLHVTPPDYAFDKDQLPFLNSEATFTATAGPGYEIEFYTGLSSGATEVYWSKTSTIEYPFDLPTNPYYFTHIDTDANSYYENCTVEVYYSFTRELQ